MACVQTACWELWDIACLQLHDNARACEPVSELQLRVRMSLDRLECSEMLRRARAALLSIPQGWNKGYKVALMGYSSS